MFAHLPVFKKAYISCLRLHQSNADWVYCGADHGKVALIDLGLTGSVDYKISWSRLKMFTCSGTDIIQLLVKGDTLIAAAQKGCFVWKVKEPAKDNKDQSHDTQLLFPGKLLLPATIPW